MVKFSLNLITHACSAALACACGVDLKHDYAMPCAEHLFPHLHTIQTARDKVNNARQRAAANSILHSLCSCSGGILTCIVWQKGLKRGSTFSQPGCEGKRSVPCWSRPDPTWTDRTLVNPFGVRRPADAMIFAAARPAMQVGSSPRGAETKLAEVTQ